MSSKKEVIMSVTQCRMARGGLQIGVRELGELAEMSPNTITRFERGEELKPRTVKGIKRALEKAGVRFFITDSGEEAVSIKVE